MLYAITIWAVIASLATAHWYYRYRQVFDEQSFYDSYLRKAPFTWHIAVVSLKAMIATVQPVANLADPEVAGELQNAWNFLRRARAQPSEAMLCELCDGGRSCAFRALCLTMQMPTLADRFLLLRNGSWFSGDDTFERDVPCLSNEESSAEGSAAS